MAKQKNFDLILAVIATGLLSFSGVLIETAMNVTFPTLIHEFGVTTAAVQWVTTICLLAISVIVPLSSYLNRNFSIRTLFVCANLFFLAGMLVNYVLPSFALLLLGRLLQGVGTGIALPLMFHIILTKAPESSRGMMMGIGTLTTAIAPAIGPTYGGVLSHYFTWRDIFLFLIPLIVLSLFLGLRSIPKEQKAVREPISLGSAVFLAATFTCILMALSASQMITAALFFIGSIVTGGLFLHFNRQKPLLHLSVLKNRRFTAMMVCFLIYQALLLGNSFVFPNYLQIVTGLDSSAAGMFMFPGAMAGALLAPISGRILDKSGAKKPIIIGLSIACVGVLLLMALLRTNVVLLLIASHVVFMVGLGLSYSNLMATSLSALRTEELSDGNAIINTLQQFVGSVATVVAAAVLSSFQHRYEFALGTSYGSVLLLGCFFLLLVASLICALIVFSENTMMEGNKLFAFLRRICSRNPAERRNVRDCNHERPL